MSEHAKLCDCPACRRGLFCADGERGVFTRGVDKCQREGCGKVAWQHWTERPCRQGARR